MREKINKHPRCLKMEIFECSSFGARIKTKHLKSQIYFLEIKSNYLNRLRYNVVNVELSARVASN